MYTDIERGGGGYFKRNESNIRICLGNYERYRKMFQIKVVRFGGTQILVKLIFEKINFSTSYGDYYHFTL